MSARSIAAIFRASIDWERGLRRWLGLALGLAGALGAMVAAAVLATSKERWSVAVVSEQALGDQLHQRPVAPNLSSRSEHTSPAALVHDEPSPGSQSPGSDDAAKRTWSAIRALVDENRLEEARSEARRMVEAYPDSPWSLDVKRHLLVHPPGPPVTR